MVMHDKAPLLSELASRGVVILHRLAYVNTLHDFVSLCQLPRQRCLKIGARSHGQEKISEPRQGVPCYLVFPVYHYGLGGIL